MSDQTNTISSGTGFEIREVGVVQAVRKFIIIARGMPSCFNGQVVEFSNGTYGLVMGFSEEKVQILVLGDPSGIRAGDEVYNKGQSLELPVGDAFVGRVVDALCRPQDGKGPIESHDSFPVFLVAPGVMDRQPVKETLESGTLVIDAIIPLAKGQRQLLIGDRLTGKTSVALDAIINQKGKDVICIYCCIGKPYSSLLKVMNILREKEALDYTVIVSGIASVSTGEQYLAPYTACMLGEYFMSKGKDVLMVSDDLTKHAWVYRQISLLLERAPGREAYPGDIFYIHSQMMERAGLLKKELGGGSMTFLPIVEILQGDLTGYIPTNLVSMTDGQLYFSTALFNKGMKPAIDFGLSVSRIGNKAQWSAMKSMSKTLRLDYLQYKELLQMTQLRTTGLSKEAEARLRRGEAINQLITQDKNKPVSMEEQIIYLYALSRGILDKLSAVQMRKFRIEILEYVQRKNPDFCVTVRQTKEITDEMKAALEEILKSYLMESFK
ncbi:MAG TPA: F0F1 ATP synthase subunit alpha [Candidatus Omnitrophota bacterium]|nr:F0F1 ATP synthase subunit alpha [Candidatus Omnitrophota bacterium]HPT07947.1 F0F1 ATP synthase subunit alpha [Candidatus Omnitrophota bacterium]